MRALPGKAAQTPAKGEDRGAALKAQVPLLPGNQALLRLSRKCSCGGSGECDQCKKKQLNEAGAQAKLEISQPGDQFEREADAAADHVTGNGRGTPKLTRYRPQAASDVPHTAPKIRRALTSGGQPLEPHTRAVAENRFGYDFSSVRVHTGPTAEESARSVQAHAYTLGDHIVFNRGQYTPGTESGQKLIAHELAHVVQQAPVLARDETKIEKKPGCLHPVSQDGEAFVAEVEDPTLIAEYGPKVYSIWGTWQKSDTGKSFFNRIYSKWMVWRFGDVDPALSEKIVQTCVSTTRIWMPNPEADCQYPAIMSLKSHSLITAAVTKQKPTAEAEERESSAGLIVVDEALEPSEMPRPQPGNLDEAIAQTIAEAEAGDEPKDPNATLIPDFGNEFKGGEKGANASALPASIKGPDRQAAKGIGTYTMRLEYWPAGYNLISQVAEAMNYVYYHWETYNITSLVEQGLKEQAVGSLKQSKVSDPAAVGKLDATKRRAEIRASGLQEDTKNALEGLADPLGEATGLSPDVVVQRAVANYYNIVLLPASSIVALGGTALGTIADAVGGTFNEQEIPWGGPGFYLVRCIAQPSPQGSNNETIRAASVAVKVVEVRSHEELAKSALGDPEADIAELNLARELETDPEKIKKIDAQLAERKLFATGTAIEVIKARLERVKQERDAATGRRRAQLDEDVTTLQKQLALAESRETEFVETGMRPRATIASEVTGEAYPLLLQVGAIENKSGSFKYRVSDVTSKKGEYWDGGGSSPSKAVWNALRNMAGHNDYGRGTLSVRFPDDSGIYPLEESLRNAPRDTKIAEERINDLITVLIALGLLVPGVGQVAAVLGAAVAASRIIHRIQMGTFEWDAEAIGDIISILGAAAQGVTAIGRLRVLRAGKNFVAATDDAAAKVAMEALEKAEKTLSRALLAERMFEYGGLIYGEVQVLDGLMNLAKLEAEGLISHSEARRQRAELIFQGIKDAALQISQERGRFKAKADPSGTVKSEPGKTPSVHEHGGGKIDPSAAAVGPAKKPASEGPRYRSVSDTPDGLHKVFVTEDGRVWRCSSPSCADIRAHYDAFLKAQATDPVAKADAEGHMTKLSKLEGEAKTAEAALEAAKGKPEETARQNELDAITKDIAKLDQEIREFAGKRITSEFGHDAATAKRTEALLEFITPEILRDVRSQLGNDKFKKFMEQSGTNELVLQDILRRLGVAWHKTEGDAAAHDSLLDLLNPKKTPGEQDNWNRAAVNGLEALVKFTDKYPGRVSGWFVDRFTKLGLLKGDQLEQLKAEIRLAEDLLTGRTALGNTNVEGISDKNVDKATGKELPGIYNPDYRVKGDSGDPVLAESKRLSPATTELEPKHLEDGDSKAIRQIMSQSLRTGEKDGYIRLDAEHMNYKAYDIGEIDVTKRHAALEPLRARVKGDMWAERRVKDGTTGVDVSGLRGRDYIKYVEVRFKDANGDKVTITFLVSPTDVTIHSERKL